MNTFLILDIGAGTMDILFYDALSGLHYKAVVRSPVLSVAEKASSLPGDLLVTGVEMGGGTLSKILAERAREVEVAMSLSAAATIHHDPDRVRSLGIKVVDDLEAEDLKKSDRFSHLSVGDLEPDRLEHIIQGLGIPFSFDAVGICAQDHGIPPAGVSHLDYRHNLFRAALEEDPRPEKLLYRYDEVPNTFNRLSCIAGAAKIFHSSEIYVMDSGMAAILGASTDPHGSTLEKILVLDIATSHTVAATLEMGRVAGFFEYHTKDITLERLETLLIDLAEGKLKHKDLLEEGGHGAYIRKALGFDAIETIIATGPKRKLVKQSRMPLRLGAPMGDNMMTGTAGVLEAIRRHKDLDFSISC